MSLKEMLKVLKGGLLALVMCILVALASCGGSDDTPVFVVDPDLVGVWKANTFIASNCEDEANNQSDTNLVCTSFECIEFTFEDDSDYIGRNIVDSVPTISEGTWSAENGTLTIDVPGVIPLTGTYTVSNSVLTFNYNLNGCDIQLVMDKD